MKLEDCTEGIHCDQAARSSNTHGANGDGALMRMSESELRAYNLKRGVGNAEIVHLAAERKTFKLKPFVPLEKDIQTSIMQAIAVLNLGSCTRYNSGSLKIDDRYVKFNSAEGHSDLAGVLSPSGRAYFLETKRPGWNGPTTEREMKQAAFLDEQRAAGALAAFVCSVDEALAVLRGTNGATI